MPKYEKNIEYEEEGSYHQRQIEPIRPVSPNRGSGYTTSYQVVRVPASSPGKKHGSRKSPSRLGGASSDEDNYEEWTTSKRKVNHKTRQVETRVSRQLLVEDGRVIADSGPQVTTRIKEDNKVEECEKEKQPKNKSEFEALENAPECEGGLGRVLGEKKEIQRVTREVREENMQYHDERFKELTGQDVHRRAIKAPHELVAIDDREHAKGTPPRGKMVHYSNKGKRYKDTDEILQVAKLAIDGSVTKETKRTHHHEESSDDERPDERGEAAALRQEPVVARSSRRHVDYVNDFDDLATPSESSDDEIQTHDPHQVLRARSGARSGSPAAARITGPTKGSAASASASHRRRHHQKHRHEAAAGQHDDEEAFPRYGVDPLLNQLKEDDFKHAGSAHNNGAPARGRRIGVERRDSSASWSSSDRERAHHHQGSARTAHAGAGAPRPSSPSAGSNRVEIPEEYRSHKQRLIHKKTGGVRALSPAEARSHLSSSRASGKSPASPHHRAAATQHGATTHHHQDLERKSVAGSTSSAASVHSHEKSMRHLQRQSTANSSRNYYFGDPRRTKHSSKTKNATPTSPTTAPKRGPSSVVSSSSSSSASSLSDPKERARHQGVQSRDSGFRSPHGAQKKKTHHQDPQEQQIYSVSSKSRKHPSKSPASPAEEWRRHSGAASPTPSAGGRSVKTTITTHSMGLADERPQSRASQTAAATRAKKASKTEKASKAARGSKKERRLTRNKRVGCDPKDLSGTALATSYHNTQAPQSHVIPSGEHQFASIDRQSLLDSISLASHPNSTTIKVPYNDHRSQSKQRRRATEAYLTEQLQASQNKQFQHSSDDSSSINKTSNDLRLHKDIENLRRRLSSIDRPLTRLEQPINDSERRVRQRQRQPPQQFVGSVDYSLAPQVPRQSQVIDAYNVHSITLNSPFQPLAFADGQLDNSIERLLDDTTMPAAQGLENNNESGFDLRQFTKHQAVPVLIDYDDSVSQVSIGSSTRTYHVRREEVPMVEPQLDQTNQTQTSLAETQNTTNNKQATDERPPTTANQCDDQSNAQAAAEVASLGHEDKAKPAAWIFDLRDNSSKVIVPPPKPRPPTPPRVETEDLGAGTGGFSYYLGLVEEPPKKPEAQLQTGPSPVKRDRPSSIDSLYSRWNSHSTLSHSTDQGLPVLSTMPVARAGIKSTSELNALINNTASRRPLSRAQGATQTHDQTKTTAKKSPKQQACPTRASSIPVGPRRAALSSVTNLTKRPSLATSHRHLPSATQSVASLSNRSKSSSCLVAPASVRSSKYSIYGGLRKPSEDSKPVPRLSYSRTIGPKSQRQINAQPKVASRYLKVR